MLFALGIRIATVKWNDLPIALWCSALTPLTGLILVFALQPFLKLEPMQFSVFILFGAAAAGGAELYGGRALQPEPAKVASMVLISNMASAIVIPIAPAVAGVLDQTFKGMIGQVLPSADRLLGFHFSQPARPTHRT